MGVYEGECMWRSPEDEPLTLTRCHSCGLLQLYEALEGGKSVYGRAYNLKGIKGLIYFFLFKLCFFLLSPFHSMMRADPAVMGEVECVINKSIIYGLFKYLNPATAGSPPISLKGREKERRMRRVKGKESDRGTEGETPNHNSGY